MINTYFGSKVITNNMVDASKSLQLLFFLIFFLCSCTYSTYRPSSSSNGIPNPEHRMPQEPGKCYARCLIADQYKTEIDTIGVFPSHEEIPEELLQEYQTRDASTKWVKKQTDVNCTSSDPNDCFVWCIQETPAAFEQPTIVETEGTQYVITDRRVLVKAGGLTEWKEVVCDGKITSDLVTQVSSALNTRGYEGKGDGARLSIEMKAALIRFQKDNGLPIGQLDMDTLGALEVDF